MRVLIGASTAVVTLAAPSLAGGISVASEHEVGSAAFEQQRLEELDVQEVSNVWVAGVGFDSFIRSEVARIENRPAKQPTASSEGNGNAEESPRDRDRDHDHDHDHSHDQDVERTSSSVSAATPAIVPAVVDERPADCLTEARRNVDELLMPLGIPSPDVQLDPELGHEAVYNFKGIVIRDCVSNSIIAHEIGHYIHDLSTGNNWSEMQGDSMTFCVGHDPVSNRCEGGWLTEAGKTSEAKAAPGVEHAAHCIGSLLIGDSTYTRCPHDELITQASMRLASVSK